MWPTLLPLSFILLYTMYMCINNSLCLAQKYAWTFVCGRYLFQEANCFWKHSSKETVSFKDKIMSADKISEHIFAPNRGYCVSYPSNIFPDTCGFRTLRNITQIFPSFSWGIFRQVTCLDQMHVRKNIWRIISCITWKSWINSFGCFKVCFSCAFTKL